MASPELDLPTPDGSNSATTGSTADSGGATRAASAYRTRRIAANVLIGLTTLLLVVAMFSVYANRLLFSPANWSNTSTKLLEDPNIRSSTANYLVDQVYANVDVAGVLKSDLPPFLQGLAAPAAGAIRTAAVQGVETALTRPRVQDLWRKANYAANQAFITVVNGGTGAVGVNGGAVTLNLSAIVNDVATRLGLPSNLGAKLPANVAKLTVLRSNQLKLIQNVGNAIKGLALWLTILVPILFALAILLARGHRRRTLMTVGFAAVFAGVLVFLGRSLLESQVPGSLTHDASLQATIAAVVSINTGLLAEVAGAVVFVGTVLVLAAWFAGPARPCAATRRAMAPFLREHPVGTYGITLAVMTLVFLWDPIPATGKPAGIIVFTVLALVGTEVLRRQTAREFPDARPGDAAGAVRARVHEMRRGGDETQASPSQAANTTADEIGHLAELRDRGALTADEYTAAKSRLLAPRGAD